MAYTDEDGHATIEFDDNLGIYPDMELFVTGCDAWPQMIALYLAGNEENTLRNVAVYPNPNNGQFSINLPEEDCEIVVFNSLGQQVYQQSNAKGKTALNLEGLNDGIYFVNVKSASVVSTIKFVKE